MATLIQTPGTATVNQLRQDAYTNDDAVNDEVVAATAAIAAHKASGNTDHDGRYALDSALTTHKTSSDHDGRYYTEAEVDAAVVKLTGAQTVAGVKTFTDEPVIKKTNPAITLQDGAGNNRARFFGRMYEPGGAERNEAVLQAYDSNAGQFVSVLAAGMDGVVRDANNKPLATQEYVAQRVRSGFFNLQASIHVATIVLGTEYYVKDVDGETMLFVVPLNSVLAECAIYRNINSVAYPIERLPESVAFTESGYQHLAISINTQLVEGAYEIMLKWHFYRYVSGTGFVETVVTEQTGYGVLAGYAVHLNIGLSFTR